MNIVYISMVMPYDKVSNGGGQTFNFYIKNMAKEEDVNVTLIAKLLDNESDDMCPTGMTVLPVRNQKLSLKHPIQMLKDINSKVNPFCKTGNTLRDSVYVAIKKRLQQLEFTPDVIVLEFTQMVLFVDVVKKLFPKAVIWASEHDVSFLRYQRIVESEKNPLKKMYHNMIYRIMKKREIEALNQCDVIMPHNLKDAELLYQQGFSREKIMPIVAFYQKMELHRRPNKKDIVFYGAMGREENYKSAIWFIEQAMPLLTDLDVRFVIVGGNPHSSLKAYESDRVCLTGYVQDLTEIFETCMCMVAPLQLGAGIKIKVLEAMCAGVPTLTNSVGIEGIPAVDKMDYLHCETAEEYACAIREICAEKIDTGVMSENSKKCIAENFDREKSMHTYVKKMKTYAGE